MANEQTQQINLELSTLCGSLPHELTCQLDNPIRVYTQPFRLKLSSITLRQDSIITELPLKYEVMIRKNPNSLKREGTDGHTTQVRPIATFEKTLILTEDIAKNFRLISQYFRILPAHGELQNGRPHYHRNPEFLYDGRKVQMTFPQEDTEFPAETDQTYIRFLNSKLADLLGVPLTTFNDMLADQEKSVHIFENPQMRTSTDLYVYCDIAARLGYKDLSSDLIRVVRIPQEKRLVHIEFNDNLWVPGENIGEIRKITLKLRDAKGEPWMKAHVVWSATLTLEGNLYKTTSPNSSDIISQ